MSAAKSERQERATAARMIEALEVILEELRSRGYGGERYGLGSMNCPICGVSGRFAVYRNGGIGFACPTPECLKVKTCG